MKLVVRTGVVSEAGGLEEEQRRNMVARIVPPIESTLSPGGLLSPVNSGDPAIFAGWPLGVALPGRKIRGSEILEERDPCGPLRRAGDRVPIRNVRRAEAHHRSEHAQSGGTDRIRVRVEGLYRPGDGIVDEGRLEHRLLAAGE
jgi:hypothetical protein